MTPVDALRLAEQVGRILDSLGIRYVAGGSVASSIHGEPRLTIDLDVMIEVDELTALQLASELAEDFYVDPEAVREAVRHASVFNVVHHASAMKLDFFIAEDDEATREQLDRRVAVTIDNATFYVYTAEDILVRKLRWFRPGGEVSDRQWRDVTGTLRIAGQRLDRKYLARAAANFHVADLLERALQEST